MPAGTSFGPAISPPQTHHVVTGQQSLQELGLLVLDRFDDELVVAGQVEERAAGPRV